MRFKSFSVKIILSHFLLIFVSFGIFFIPLNKSLQDNSLQDIQLSLIRQARLIAKQIGPDQLRPENTADLARLTKELSLVTNARITVINKSGRVLADTGLLPKETAKPENHLGRPEVRSALSGTPATDKRYSNTLKVDMLYAALPLQDNGIISAIIRLALPLQQVKQSLLGLRKAIITPLLISLIFALAIGAFVSNQTMKPVKKIIQAARRFAEGDFSRRIIRAPQGEIGELAKALNKMARDIEEKIIQADSQNQKLEVIFNTMLEGIIVVDRDNRIVAINFAIEKIFGITLKESAGKSFLEAMRNNEIHEIITRVLDKMTPASKEVSLIYPKIRIFEINATPLTEAGSVSGCLVVIHDITEIRKLETVRRDFLANVSHELKTPLTSIKGFVETLIEGALNDKKNNRAFLAIIHDHTVRLEKLVNDLLSLSHLESKEITLYKEVFNLKGLSDEVISGFLAVIKRRALRIINQLPSDITVTADRYKIEQVFTNLIDNAIKFNRDNGTLIITAQLYGPTLKVTVEDSGVGIPTSDIARIFERFYMVDKARCRALGGTGLGLSIVKHIIQLHNGTVGVESSEGIGSKFWFTLPA